jgi:hypothetical protein
MLSKNDSVENAAPFGIESLTRDAIQFALAQVAAEHGRTLSPLINVCHWPAAALTLPIWRPL